MLLFILFPFVSFAQDKIYKTDNTIVEAKVQEIGAVEIMYKKFNNPEGPVYKIKKENVQMIVYQNGEKKFFQEQPFAKTNVPVFDSLAYIAEYFGVKLQSNTLPKGGIKIIEKEPEHRLKKGVSAGEVIIGIYTGGIGLAVMGACGEFSLKNGVISEIGICKKGEKQCSWSKINQPSDLSQPLFKVRENLNDYENVVYLKIKKGLGASKGKVDVSELDLTAGKTFYTQDIARKYILSENINDAIAAYAQLIAKDSLNAALLAEDAYALALGGVYDAALLRLDRIWYLGASSAEENFYTAQVFALMGYDDLASAFWKASDKNKTPDWLSVKSAVLLQKYKSKVLGSVSPTSDEIVANFNQANDLAAKKSYYRSIALFRKITETCPEEYLPYIGYSIALEKTGAYEKSVQAIEKAISLIGPGTDDNEKQILQQRLSKIKGKMALVPAGTMPGFPQVNMIDAKQPQMMTYVGGMLGSSSKSLNGRIGYYISNSSNASLDFGTTNVSDTKYTNLGLSVYNRKNNLVSGGGLLLSSASESTTLFLKLSVGYSKMNKNRTSSIDIFLDVNKGLGEGSLSTWGLSIGKSFYFGQRK